MPIEDVIARLGSVLESIESARSSLTAAVDMLIDAHAILEDTWSGTSSSEAQDILTRLADAERDIRDQILALTGGDELIRAYQGYRSGGSAGTGRVATTDRAQGRRRSSPEAGTPVPAVVTPERIEQLRDELPRSPARSRRRVAAAGVLYVAIGNLDGLFGGPTFTALVRDILTRTVDTNEAPA